MLLYVISMLLYFVLMNSHSRDWNILCWNIRGLNDGDNWDPIRNKIEETSANIFYLRETKKEDFNLQFSFVSLLISILIKFDFCPSKGASGGSWFVDGLLHTLLLLLLKLT